MSSPDRNIQLYLDIRARARQIISRYPPPSFYFDFPQASAFSCRFMHTDAVVLQVLDFVSRSLENDFGHGIRHSVKVSLDAGALLIIECGRMGFSGPYIRKRLRLALCAGLLHDIRRKEKNHAAAGAAYTRSMLGEYGLAADDVEDISQAIENHEAFRKTSPVSTIDGSIISDCLYDADKFRWGPDNFMDTVWDMVMFMNIPLAQFVERYPGGMEKIASIKSTFRTETGRAYGPEFIDTGLAVGIRLYEVIQNEFAEFL